MAFGGWTPLISKIAGASRVAAHYSPDTYRAHTDALVPIFYFFCPSQLNTHNFLQRP